jgi:hypothetical protein
MDRALQEVITILGVASASAVVWHSLLRRWIPASTASGFTTALVAYGAFHKPTPFVAQTLYVAMVLVIAWVIALGVGIPFNRRRGRSLPGNISRRLNWIEIIAGLVPAAVLTYLLFRGRT